MVFSLVSLMNSMFQRSFVSAGLRSHNVSIDSETRIHCWISAPLPVQNETDHNKTYSDPKPVLLLIHGFGPVATWHWSGQVGPLSRHFDLIVPDLIFFGGSSSASPLRSEIFQAEMFGRLLDVLGLTNRRVSVAGTSYGGYVAYQMGRLLGPERVDRVVVASSDLLKTEEDTKELMSRAGGVDDVANLMLPKNTKYLRSLLMMTVYKAPKFMPEFLLRDILRSHFTENLKVKEEIIKGIITGTKDCQLTPLPQKVLIIWGEHDKIFPSDKAYKVKEKLGEKARLEILPKTGHMPHQEDPKRFNKILLNFLLDS